MATILYHPFPPLYDSHSRVLILGSFPSVVSREQSFYYANKSNRFWPVLSAVYGEEITDRKEFCLRHGIALWDVIASCSLRGSSDQSIRNVTVNPIAELIAGTEIKAVFTTGRKAGALYRKYTEIDLPHYELPSTSAANATMRTDDLIRYYRKIREAADEKD